jgi:hypothetical protein
MAEGGTASPGDSAGGYSYGAYSGAGGGNGAGSASYGSGDASSGATTWNSPTDSGYYKSTAANEAGNLAKSSAEVGQTVAGVLSAIPGIGLVAKAAGAAIDPEQARIDAITNYDPNAPSTDAQSYSQGGDSPAGQGNANMANAEQVASANALAELLAKDPQNIDLQAQAAQLSQVPGLADAISGQMSNIQTGGVGTDIDLQQTANNALLSSLASGDNTNSQAARQLQQTTQQNAAQAAGAMASARGLTPAQAARLSLNQTAAGNQQAAGQAANLRSTEQVTSANALTSALSNQRAGRSTDVSTATGAAGTLGTLNTNQNQQTLQNQEQTQNYNLDVAKANQAAETTSTEGNKNRAVQMRAQDIGVDAAETTSRNQLVGSAINAGGAILSSVLAEGGRAGESGLDMAISGRDVDSVSHDKVPAMLTPGEGVIPRSIMDKDNAPELAAAFVAGIKSMDLPSDDSYGGLLARNRGRADELAKIDSELMACGGRVKRIRHMGDGGEVESEDGLYRRFVKWLQSSGEGGTEAGQNVARSLNAALPEAVSGANLVRGNKRLTDELDAIARMADGGPVQRGLGSPTPLVEPALTTPPTNGDPLQADMLRRQQELERLLGGTASPTALPASSPPNPNAINPQQLVAMAPGAPDTSGIPVNSANLQPPAPAAAPVAPSVAPSAPSVPQFGSGPSTIGQGISEQQRAIEQQAAARAEQAAQQKAIYEQGLADQKTIAAEADQERSAIQKRMSSTRDAIVAGDVKPDHYWTEKGTFGRVSSAIAIALSGIGQGLAGGENLALKTINQAIDRDIDAQKANMQKNVSLYGMDQGDLQANVAMENHLRARALGSVEGQLQMATAQSKTKEEKANGRLLMGQLEIQKNQLLQDSAVKRAQMAASNIEIRRAGEQERQLRDYQAWKEQGIKNPAAMQDREWLVKGQLNNWLPQGAGGGGGVTTYVQDTRKDVLGNTVNRVVPVQVRPASKEAEAKLRESSTDTATTLAALDALEQSHTKSGKWVPFTQNRAEWKTAINATVGKFRLSLTGPGAMSEGERKLIMDSMPDITDTEAQARAKLAYIRRQILDKAASDVQAYGAG